MKLRLHAVVEKRVEKEKCVIKIIPEIYDNKAISTLNSLNSFEGILPTAINIGVLARPLPL